tara:strand:- start:181 stop:615 length:435 start_codon:yes stop_codon:yes gene_type:complete
MNNIINTAHAIAHEVHTKINSKINNNNNSKFKNNHSFEKRANEAQRIIDKYPDRIPVIVEKDPRCRDIPDIDRKKYLVPDDLTMANFMYVIRKRIKLSPEKSLYLFVAETNLVPCSQMMRTIYDDFSSPDNFLYIMYAGESTFG